MAVGFPTKDTFVNGDVYSAGDVNDLAGTVNLLESAQYAAGKNKIINGDFGIWQRGTSFTTTDTFTADRWRSVGATGTFTVSQQAFTPGAAPVAGYESQYFIRYASTVALDPRLFQPIEDVRTCAGETVTVSFWAKSATSDALSGVQLSQIFGTGGSTTVTLSSGAITLTSSWTRYSVNFTLGSLSGKTIGTNSNLRLTFDLKNSATFDFDLWGVQVEESASASEFETASGGSKQGELAMCQRYYQRLENTTAINAQLGLCVFYSTTAAKGQINLPVSLRIPPTALDYASVQLIDTGVTTFTPSAITIATSTNSTIGFDATVSGATQHRAGWFRLTATSGYLAFNVEL